MKSDLNPATAPAVEPSQTAPAHHRSALSRMLGAGQFLLALVMSLAALGYLLFSHDAAPHGAVAKASSLPPEPAEVAGPSRVRVRAGTPLAKRLQEVEVATTQLKTPLLKVTGTVVASFRQGPDKTRDGWQFNSPELLTVYTDWQKAIADITFSETQLKRVRELITARLDAQQKVVGRLEKTVRAGTDAPKDLIAEQANLMQVRIAGEKEIYEQETAVKIARRNAAALVRQMQQNGVDPELLESATEMDLVVAEVPEGFLSRVRVGQACEARFVGIVEHSFPGRVDRIAQVISRERRSLRVLFAIHDPQNQLHPGMYADIGLGTDPRPAILVSPDSIVHIGRADYLMVAAQANEIWKVAPVQVGDSQEGRLEILSGLKVGDRILAQNAILLKPLMSLALTTSTEAPSTASNSASTNDAASKH